MHIYPFIVDYLLSASYLKVLFIADVRKETNDSLQGTSQVQLRLQDRPNSHHVCLPPQHLHPNAFLTSADICEVCRLGKCQRTVLRPAPWCLALPSFCCIFGSDMFISPSGRSLGPVIVTQYSRWDILSQCCLTDSRQQFEHSEEERCACHHPRPILSSMALTLGYRS